MQNSDFLKIRSAKKCSPDKIRALKFILSVGTRELSILNRFLNFLFFSTIFNVRDKLKNISFFVKIHYFPLYFPYTTLAGWDLELVFLIGQGL